MMEGRYKDDMKAFLLVLASVYAIIAAKKMLRFWDLTVSLKTLDRFITAYEYKRDLQKEYNSLLRRYPYIKNYVYEPRLDYSQSISTAASSSVQIFNQLLMIRNENIRDIKQLLNPFCVLKEMAFFPSTVLSAIGIRTSGASEFIINSLSWAIPFFAKMFYSEIKEFIVSILF